MSRSTLNFGTLTRPPRSGPADIVGPVEKALLDAPGACKSRLDFGWKLGRMLLTEKRFVFLAHDRIKIQVPLDEVITVETQRRPFVLASTTTVRLSWGKQAARSPRELWLATKDIQAWRDALFQMTCLEVTAQAIEELASALDERSAALLWYVWHERHAGIDELAELIDAGSHDHVLNKIRKTINPAAVKLLGRDVLVFRHRWKAPGSSEPVGFHWWIAGRRKTACPVPAAQGNVFEEPGYVDVVVDLPGVRGSDVMLTVRDHRLIISAASDTQKFHGETPLPGGICTDTMTWRMNNGVLLARFRRHSRPQTAYTRHPLSVGSLQEGK